MKPEYRSRRLFAITRAKGKMYELGLPERLHIAVPPDAEPQELFLLTVGTLGDAAAILSGADNVELPLLPDLAAELGFSASFFDAFFESRFDEVISRDTVLLAASCYYLARRPGSSLVLARRLREAVSDSAVDKLLLWTLQSKWTTYPSHNHPFFGSGLAHIAELVAFHFFNGSNLHEITTSLASLRERAYAGASARDLLFTDVIASVIRMRLAASAWTTLPVFTGIPSERWAPSIRRPEFPKELWPSQVLLGRAGIFSGASGVVQMPTSAGKTRAIEIVLRSAFLSGRTKLAVVVAPFRALCHEIGTSLRHSFREDETNVNELSDAMQVDFLHQVSEWLGLEAPTSQNILVLTPEKLLYILRQTPALIGYIGLVVYDEGHQFDSGSRGITYELLLTEIKGLLPAGAQTLLVSAVVQNAHAIGNWLMGDGAKVVNGSSLLSTARSVAFASWSENLGQLMFYESDEYDAHDYFVPRVIEQSVLKNLPRERVERYFPEKSNSVDVALYLGIRLVPQGSVAIFCGRKDTASGIADRAVGIYERGFEIAPPAASADPEELRRLKNLVEGHFGEQGVMSRAASIGVFVHHGTTPQGLRLSIEHGMQQGKINFVACTSTLAQGVNLPIRYLIVSGIHQGADRIKVRDFQNLIGRAGRSGMYTEGLVIFSDPSAYDSRHYITESWKFASSVQLLTPSQAESTTSSLLALLEPIYSSDRKATVLIYGGSLLRWVLLEEQNWVAWANEVVRLNPYSRFDAKTIVSELRRRRRMVFAVESYLMANRGDGTSLEFKASAEQIAMSTLAYHLANADQKDAIKALFVAVADYVDMQEPAPARQASFSKTLLGVKSAKAIEQWVQENRDFLHTLDSNAKWLVAIWPVFARHADSKFFNGVEPEQLAVQLATLWIEGASYQEIFSHSKIEHGTKPWGNNRRRLTDDDIIKFCEATLGFECTLIVAAVAQFLFGHADVDRSSVAALELFQKSLKYGVPDWLSISAYELGFSDRVLAQHLSEVVTDKGFDGLFFGPAITSHHVHLNAVLTDYPSYFESVFASRALKVN